MSNFDAGSIRGPAATGRVSAIELRQISTGKSDAARPAPSAAGIKDALDPGQPPIDFDRVSQIRKAIEDGRYPLVPQRVADAMIAAGHLLRTGK